MGVWAGAAVADPPCRTRGTENYRRKGDLPVGAIEATGVSIAEKGGAYQRGDVMVRGLPLYRFVGADRAGCRLRIRYERGGFAQHRGTFLLTRIDSRWKLIGQD